MVWEIIFSTLILFDLIMVEKKRKLDSDIEYGFLVYFVLGVIWVLVFGLVGLFGSFLVRGVSCGFSYDWVFFIVKIFVGIGLATYGLFLWLLIISRGKV